MTQEEYLKRFTAKCEAEIELTRKKNSDYAGAEEAFRNFTLVETITNGRIKTIDGLLVRMTDKFIRFANLIERPAQVADEKITDTLDDLSVYSKIAAIWLESQADKQLPHPAMAQANQPQSEDMKEALLAELNETGTLSPTKRTLLQMLHLDKVAA